MDPANLIEMANRIGEFFEAMPDRREALDGIATHVRKFWAPRMRRELFEALDRGNTAELAPLVREALLARRADLEPEALRGAEASAD